MKYLIRPQHVRKEGIIIHLPQLKQKLRVTFLGLLGMGISSSVTVIDSERGHSLTSASPVAARGLNPRGLS